MTSRKQCSIDGCDRRHYGKGMCNLHWARWKRTGDPQASRPPLQRRDGCGVDGCDRKHRQAGLCDMHSQRMQRYGSVDLPPRTVRLGPETSGWRGDGVGYPAAHTRVVRRLGSASLHLCVNCGGQAMDWAYDHRDPNELECSDTRRKYSGDPNHYVPLCRPCHKRIDNAARRGDLEAARLVMWR